MRGRSGGFALENLAGGGPAREPAADRRDSKSSGSGGAGRGRTGGFVLDDDPTPVQEAADDAGRRRSGALAEDVHEDDGRRRSGAISLSSEFRKSKDDTILQDLPGHTDPDMVFE